MMNRRAEQIQRGTAKSSLTISAKPVGVGAACQPWALAGEQSSLLMPHRGDSRLRRIVLTGWRDFFKTRCRQPDPQSWKPRSGKRKERTMDLSKASPRELAIELGKRSAGSGMDTTKTLAALMKAGLDKKTRAKVTKNEKELTALIRRATDSFWQHEAAIDWQNGSFPEIVRKTYITAFIRGALEGRNEGGS
jgi:hypothetical protein